MKTFLLTTAAAAALLTPALACAADAPNFSGVLAAGVSANDNIFATNFGEISDTVFTLNGGLNLSRHSAAGDLSAYARIDLAHYADHSDENADDYAIGADGSLNLASGQVSAGASHVLTTESRKARVARRDTVKRTEYVVDEAHAAFVATVETVRLTGRLSYSSSDYDNGRVRGTGALALQDDRDRTTQTQSLRADFKADQAMSFFGKVQHVGIDYDLAPPASRHNRDSDTVSVTGGVTFNATADLTGEIEAGWAKRTFDDAAFADVSDLSLSANLDWTAAKGTDVTFNASRSLEEEVLTGSSIYVATVVGVAISHHVGARWALGGYASREWDDHKGINRKDDVSAFGVSAAFQVSDRVEAKLAYDFTTEDSSGARRGPGYDNGVVSAGLKAKF